MRAALIIGLLAATGIAATSIADEMQRRNDPLVSPALEIVPGCISHTVDDPVKRETIAYKRERPCKGETR